MGWLVVPVPFPCCRLSRIAGACEQEGPAFFVTAVVCGGGCMGARSFWLFVLLMQLPCLVYRMDGVGLF